MPIGKLRVSLFGRGNLVELISSKRISRNGFALAIVATLLTMSDAAWEAFVSESSGNLGMSLSTDAITAYDDEDYR